jgi:hypothetical protein
MIPKSGESTTIQTGSIEPIQLDCAGPAENGPVHPLVGVDRQHREICWNTGQNTAFRMKARTPVRSSASTFELVSSTCDRLDSLTIPVGKVTMLAATTTTETQRPSQ